MCVTQWKANRTRRCPQVQPEGRSTKPGAAYDNDVQVMQRTLESEYEVSLGRVCQRYN